MLTRYWFSFSTAGDVSLPMGVAIGCGVSAYSYDDAIQLITQRVFTNNLPNIDSVVEEIDISTLDQGHVIPNMGDVTIRGVWFPLGY